MLKGFCTPLVQLLVQFLGPDWCAFACAVVGYYGSIFCTSVHIVKAGQTITQIAALYGVSAQTLLKANPSLPFPEYISAGMSLNVPPCLQQASTISYTVQTSCGFTYVSSDLAHKNKDGEQASCLYFTEDVIHLGNQVAVRRATSVGNGEYSISFLLPGVELCVI